MTQIIRRCAIVALLLALVLAVSACKREKEPEPPTQPEALSAFLDGTKLNGIDLSGKTPEEAAALLKKTVETYELKVTLDGVEFSMDAARLGLTYNEKADLAALLKTQDADHETLTFEGKDLFLTGDAEELRTALLSARDAAVAAAEEAGKSSEASGEEAAEPTEPAEALSWLDDPTRAHLEYDTRTGEFIGVDGAPGISTDYTKAVEAVQEAARGLAERVTVTSEQKQSAEGEKAEGNAALAEAVETANSYLQISLTYSFTPEGKDTSYEYINRDRVASWLLIQSDGRTVALNTEAIASYCSTIARRHSVSGEPVQFRTTLGGYINVNSYRGGQSVDSDALYADLLSCLKNRVSGNRTATYYAPSDSGGVEDYGGSYVEVDLTNQMVYCYKDHALVVSAPIVSGCVANGWDTPEGVFTIKSKDTNRYLSGPGYRDWVECFMPFNGGIGLHDASWRTVFGGTRYLYRGSHGCINIPRNQALTILANVRVGTYVIVYGGLKSVEGRTQVWSGTTSYTLTPGSAPVKLDVRPSGDAVISQYESMDPSVCTVSQDGVITPVGEGTCTVYAYSEGTQVYKDGECAITVTVTKQTQTISAPESLVLNPGDKTPLNASASSGAALRYESSDPAVAAVSADGTVTAAAAGSCEITITAPGSAAYAQATKKVTVQVVKRTQRLSGQTAYTVQVGDGSFRLDVTALGGAALCYSSSDPSVCTVDDSGLVTIVGEGSCTITVTAAETAEYQAGSLTITITVTPETTEPPNPTKPTEPSDGTDPSEEPEPTEPSEP